MLQAGRITEDGAPDLLLQGKGPYRELVAREMGRLATSCGLTSASSV